MAAQSYLKDNYEKWYPGISTIPLGNMNLNKLVGFLKIIVKLLKSKELLPVLCDVCVEEANHSYFYKEKSAQQIAEQETTEKEGEIKEDTDDPVEAAEPEKVPKGTLWYSMSKPKPKPKPKPNPKPPIPEGPEIIHCFTLLDLMLFRVTENEAMILDDLKDYLKIISTLINKGARFSVNGTMAPLTHKGKKYEYFETHVFKTLSPYYDEDDFKDLREMFEIQFQVFFALELRRETPSYSFGLIRVLHRVLQQWEQFYFLPNL